MRRPDAHLIYLGFLILASTSSVAGAGSSSDEEENRRKLVEEEENLRKLNEEIKRKQAEDSEADNIVHIRKAEKLKRGLERRAFVHQRRQRRKSGEQVDSTTSEESLTAPIGRLTKVVSRVNKESGGS